ncbi:methionine--tRNA ligase [Candidatus Babeliales bacterium]|nr:methionine--tRNA ligase [Candidatus Babeliales bacterium]MCF7899220.1 methionine--tRNA ligase [Candidatus Babeliales bacterium]
MPKNNKFYVTTPIYYVNAKPHIGTLYSSLLADVAARWNKLCGKNTFFLTGTDEHGQKLAECAKKSLLQPKDFVDLMVPNFKNTWKTFEINYDKFIRTTDEDHKLAVIKLIDQLYKNDDIYKSVYSGLYCVPDERFVVTNEAIKDEKNNYLCPICKRALIEVAEESYFFRLSAYEDKLLDFFEKNPDFITPKERMHEVVAFVKSGLKDLSISRKSVEWGIEFPLESEHTVYVWADALTNYLSGIGFAQKDKEQDFDYWWPADLQIMAKDILRFHAVYWIAFLMALKLELPKKMLVHGYILSNGNKMSKSLGNVMDPEKLAQMYGVEPVRYYLIRQMSINQDGNFILSELENHVASDLANGLGNLLNRTLTLALNNNLQKLKAPDAFNTETLALREKCEEAFRSFWDQMNHYSYHVALADLWTFIGHVNAYFHRMEPWVAAKKDKDLFYEIIYASCCSLYTIGVLLWPIMPGKMQELLKSLGHDFDLKNNYEQELRDNKWTKNFILTKIEPLFTRPENFSKKLEKPISESKEVVSNDTKTELSCDIIDINDFAKVYLIVGTILSCESVSGSDKLYKLQVDLGKMGIRQILSGIAKFFKPEDLVNKQGVYVTNLAPRKMMGYESNGMMLFAKDEIGNMKMVTVSGFVENGTRLS